MWEWLNGPGAPLKDPLPGSTNYLNAYNNYGKLRRVSDQNREEGDEKKTDSEQTNNGELPAETSEDLRPFRLNQHFRSQPVLSEDFKEVIWDRVMNQGMSVSQVSRDLGVEMNRVGAVVRLKELENQWDSEVCFSPFPFSSYVNSSVVMI